MQIRLQNNRAVIGNRAVLQVTALRKNSYLRIDCSYEVSIVVLEGTVDSLGGGLRVRVKKEGDEGAKRVFQRGGEGSR